MKLFIPRSVKKIILTALVLCMPLSPPKPAYACEYCILKVVPTEAQRWLSTSATIMAQLTAEMTAYKIWYVSTFWEDNILPAMMMMAEQLTATAMLQMQIIGSFMDAQQQMETQRLLQKIAARTHKDYQPSLGLCEFGSGAKSLASSDRKAEMNSLVLSQRAQDRHLGSANTFAASGDPGDKENRIRQFREKYCDPQDNNNGLLYMCDWDQKAGGNVGGADPKRFNKDIDYIRTIDAPWTLDMDFISKTKDAFDNKIPSADLTGDEEDVIALANNLYGDKVFFRPGGSTLGKAGDAPLSSMQRYYMDLRSIVAKRAVAENSFNAIAAMKSEGTPGSRDYLVGLMNELGIPVSDAQKMLGNNPSYYAQMEVLTKKIYHNPDFYTNLYDKPANVERKGVALQAIALMQKFDLFKSYLRNEASLSVLLELAVMDLQEEAENLVNPMTGQGTPAKK